MDNTDSNQPKGLLTPLDVSRLLRIPESTLAVWRSTGRVQLAFVKIGGHVRYRQADIDRLMAGKPGAA